MGAWEVRGLAAIKAPGATGPGAAPAIPKLTRALSDREGWMRCQAAASLGSVASSAAGTAPAMFNDLRCTDGFQP